MARALLDLPEDILCYALEYLDLRSLLRMARVCKTLNSLVHLPRLQYLIHLEAASLVPEPSIESVPERLKRIIDREQAWWDGAVDPQHTHVLVRGLTSAQIAGLPLSTVPRHVEADDEVPFHAIRGGWAAIGGGRTEAGYPPVVARLPDRNTPQSWDKGASLFFAKEDETNAPFRVEDARIVDIELDPSQNLLILVERLNDDPDSFRLRFLSMDTYLPHPAVANALPTFTDERYLRGGAEEGLAVQVLGPLLATLVRGRHLVVWDWTKGMQPVAVFSAPSPSEDPAPLAFAFLTPHTFVLLMRAEIRLSPMPSLVDMVDEDEDPPQRVQQALALEVFRLPTVEERRAGAGAEEEEDQEEGLRPKLLGRLRFPDLAVDTRVVTAELFPEPLPSTNESHDPASGILTFELWGEEGTSASIEPDWDEEIEEIPMTGAIARSALLLPVQASSSSPSPSSNENNDELEVDLLWEEWGPQNTRFFYDENMPSTYPSFGGRMVQRREVFVAEDDEEEEDDEESDDEDEKYELYILDFNRHSVRLEETQTEPSSFLSTDRPPSSSSTAHPPPSKSGESEPKIDADEDADDDASDAGSWVSLPPSQAITDAFVTPPGIFATYVETALPFREVRVPVPAHVGHAIESAVVDAKRVVVEGPLGVFTVLCYA